MNYGKRGLELLVDLKRSDGGLPSYNGEGVRATLQEIDLHYREITNQVAAAASVSSNSADSNNPPVEARASLILHDVSIRRNKRCLLSYHASRCDALRTVHKESARLPPHIRPLLSESEIDFFQAYDKLVTNYAQDLEIDLASHQSPPETHYVQVRVMQPDLGEIATEAGGAVSLDLGTTHFLPRNDVEHLIRQGALQQLNGEECI